MKFKIRQPFSIHMERMTEVRQGGGVKIKQRNLESHFADETVDLDAKEAKLHLHKLEPVDAEAKSLIDAVQKEHAEAVRRRVRAQDSGPSLEERIAGAVVAALGSAGALRASARA